MPTKGTDSEPGVHYSPVRLPVDVVTAGGERVRISRGGKRGRVVLVTDRPLRGKKSGGSKPAAKEPS